MTADGSFEYAGAPSPEELAAFDLNDFGNAMRFIRLTGGFIEPDGEINTASSRVLYLRQRGWIVFNGFHWDLQHGEALAKRHAARVGQTMMAQAKIRYEELKADEVKGKALLAPFEFVTQCGNSGRINALLDIAANYLVVDLDAFDRDPFAINCRNGVVRLARVEDGIAIARFRTGHAAGDRMTRMVDAEYQPDAKAPLFAGVVDFALPRRAVRDYVHKALGYALTGSTEEQAFFVFQGKGGDGKSTVVNAVRETMGSYATVSAVETFLDTGLRRGAEASPDIAELAGDTRMISAGEPPSGSKLATGAIKTFTGGGKTKARELRQGLFEFSPVGKVIIECNRRPTINDTDDGIWRRLKIVLFDRQVPRDQIDGRLPEKLKAEKDGILAWLVEGAVAWMNHGLKAPAEVEAALEDYRRGSNPFAQWLAERVIMEDGARTRASDFFNDYKRWCEDNQHEKPMSQRAFGAALGDLQIILGPKDGAGKVTRIGARLRSEFDAPREESAPGAGGPEGSDAGVGPDPLEPDDRWGGA